jgi:hypothetical protein
MRMLDTIIVHCTATRADWWADRRSEDKLAECRKWHTDPPPNGRGWSDIGYHYLIDRDGTVLEGRPIERAGAHAKGHNAHSVGISLWGGHGGTQDDKFEEHFTPEQDRALRRLIAQLRMEYPAIKSVIGHNEVSPKMCPCFQVTEWMNNAEAGPKPERTKVSQSKTIQASSVAKVASAATPLVGVLGGLPWQNLAIMGVLAVIALIALGVIDLERLKKWNKGDR